MRKTHKFDAFGRNYRTTQFAAVPALVLMDKRDELEPTDVLAATEAEDYDGTWHELSTRENINLYVTDAAEALPPRVILDAIMVVANRLNFGFLSTWKGAKVPRRFTTGATSIQSEHVDPLVATLVQDEVASLRELEEYYSLEDAFKMFDIQVVKGINKALSHEAMEREAKSKRK